MLYTANNMLAYKLNGSDGEVGIVKDFYFDDHHWAVRYLVADTQRWLPDRLVLISPHAVTAVNTDDRHISLELTKKQIEDSPPWSSDKPVSSQFEEAYYGYYGWPNYWSGPLMWGPYSYISRDRESLRGVNTGGKAWDPHLRSISTVIGYDIQASDGEIGHVEDFVLDDETWAIRYLVIDTRNWLPGRKVLISPKWLERVSWSESKVFVNLLRETIKQSPEYDGKSLLTRDYEIDLHRHYGFRG